MPNSMMIFKPSCVFLHSQRINKRTGTGECRGENFWGLSANTFNIEVPVKLTPFFSISPFYRYYSQNGVKYFASYKSHVPSEEFYTTDDDLSKFNSNFLGAGVRFTPPGGLLNIRHLNALELRYGHYKRTDGLHSDIITLSLKFK